MPHARGTDGRGNIRHGVVNGETGGHAATGRVDVELDWFFRRIGFKEEQLGDNGSGNSFVNGTIEADDSFLRFRGNELDLSLSEG